MRNNESYMSNNSALNEDIKKIRKLRKVLRQIEHLQLLTRALNSDEKLKVSRRLFYREQLSALNIKYKNVDILEDSLGTTFESEESRSFSLNASNGSERDNAVISESFEHNLNQLSQRFDSFFIKEENQTKVEEKEEEEFNMANLIVSSPIESRTVPQIKVETEIKQVEIKKVEEKLKKETKVEVKKVDENKQPLNSVKETEKVLKVPEKAVLVKPKEVKQKIEFESFELANVHEDLVVSVDICNESNLIVTGSRDTTLKVWSIENPKKMKLVHSFGGHSSSITFVKFWKFEFFRRSLESLVRLGSEDDSAPGHGLSLFDAQIKLEKLNEENENEEVNKKKLKYPLVLSSSLDCSIRVWDINSGICIKEFYLYNKINHFQIHETSFAIGLDAGKLQYWNNLNEMCVLKPFEDTEPVCCVKFLVSNEKSKKLYALSVSGVLKVFSVVEKQTNQIKNETLQLEKQENIYSSLVSNSENSRKNFKFFEIINENEILLINDYLSFVILYNSTKKSCQFISTNINEYGFTNCFTKCDDKFFISAYNIDDAAAYINLFEFGGKKSSFEYRLSIEESEEEEAANHCISTLGGCRVDELNRESFVLVSGSDKSVKLWKIELGKETAQAKTNKKYVKYKKMSKQVSLNSNEEDDEDDDDEESDVENCDEENNGNNKRKPSEDDGDKEKSSKSYCSLM